jgi:two-component system, LytTR family, response regulator
MLAAIAIDDEPAALEVLARHAEKVPFLALKKTFLSPTEALAHVRHEPVDVVFLDVQMPDLPGTELARLLPGKAIIFTTAHPQYAVEGFNLQVLDFLLKPIAFGRFLQACNRAYQQVAQQQGQARGIFVKDGYDWVRVWLDEVLYVQSDTNLLFIYERGRRTTTRMTIGELLDLLPPDQFLRVHKSYIVAARAVQKVERHQLTVGGALIPLAASYRDDVLARLVG